MNDPRTIFHEELSAGAQLCLLPISRVALEAPVRLGPRLVLYPPGAFLPDTFRIVSYPALEYAEANRRADELTLGVLHASGMDLAWLTSSVTGLECNDFLASALLALPVSIDWDKFLQPENHRDHLAMIQSAMAEAEAVLDQIRFDYCRLDLPQALPGRAGFLSPQGFSAALFYMPRDHESYIVAGEIVTHQIVVGLGLEFDHVAPAAPISSGPVGGLARHALRLFNMALEAPDDTAKFVQLMTLIDYLADPFAFTSMKDAKKQIGRHVAQTRQEYEAIMEDFKVLTSEGGKPTAGHQGYRHNIVHLGRRLEDLIDANERRAVMQRLQTYISVLIQDFIDRSHEGWESIVAYRDERGRSLGLIPTGETL